LQNQNNSHENREISILKVKKARTRLKLLLEVKENFYIRTFRRSDTEGKN
jgi:hypothetical protein